MVSLSITNASPKPKPKPKVKITVWGDGTFVNMMRKTNLKQPIGTSFVASWDSVLTHLLCWAPRCMLRPVYWIWKANWGKEGIQKGKTQTETLRLHERGTCCHYSPGPQRVCYLQHSEKGTLVSVGDLWRGPGSGCKHLGKGNCSCSFLYTWVIHSL